MAGERLNDQTLRRIAAGASSLWERQPFGPLKSDIDRTSARTLRRRLARWRDAVARGDIERFRRRLAWDGLSERTARHLLANVEPSAIVHLPQWAQTVREIVEMADHLEAPALPDVPPAGACDASEPLPFEDALIPAIAAARSRLAARAPLLCGDAVCSGMLSSRAYLQIERSLLRRLSSTAEATLYEEFCQRRPLGATLLLRFGVPPANSRQRPIYDAFVSGLLADGLVTLFRGYPVLARLLATVVDTWVEATTEFLERLATDRSAIARLTRCRTPTDLGPVTNIACDLGDHHRGGRSVMSVTFGCGATVMYKPKPIGLEVAFTDLVRWIYERGSVPALRAQRVFDGGEYGWVEHVETVPTKSGPSGRRFYHRAGMLQALLYAVGATDCHSENLIQSGQGLVLVDMETLLQPRVTPVGDDEGHLDTVLQTGLLPQWECQQDTRRAVDVSGLAFGAAGTSAAPRWQFVNTDAMHIVSSDEASPVEDSKPRENGASLQNGFEDEFVTGFEQMYRHLVRHRAALLAPGGPLRAFRTCEARLLFRATQTYVNIADAAVQPRAMRSGTDWSIELEHLAFAFLASARRPIAWPILHAERRAMEQLDVPYFSCPVSEPTLLGVDPPLRGYVRASGYDQTIARVRQLNERDLTLQRAIIRGAVAAHVSGPHAIASGSDHDLDDGQSLRPLTAAAAGWEDPSERSTRLIEEAVLIGRLLADRGIELSRGRINWLGLTWIRNNQRLQVSLLSPNLYDGVCGVSVFLAALARVSGADRFADLALRAIASVRRAIRGHREGIGGTVADELGIGAAFGAGSVIYALCKVGEFLGEPSLFEDAMVTARGIAPDHIRRDAHFDVMSGAAGTILGLLALHRLTRDRMALRRATSCGRHLVAAQIEGGPRAGCWPRSTAGNSEGFAHGASGIAVALLRLYALTRDDTFRLAAERALRAARKGLAASGLVSWCHGAAGTGLACVDALATIESPALRRDTRRALAVTQKASTSGVDHLCCGSMGRTETLIAGALVLADQRLVQFAGAHAGEVVRRARIHGAYRLQSTGASRDTVQNPALFQGLAGIGYQLLRLARPEAVPSLLLFR